MLEGNAELPTFVNHVGFVQGLEHTPGFSTDFKIGFSKLKAGKFYSALENRWELYDKQYGTNISEKNAEERHPLLEKTYASLN
mgnify:FL=1